MKKLGLADEHFVVRMTGCPNGCARPYMAELGFVGSLANTYQIWLGGSPNQTRLAQPYMDRLHIDNLETTLEPILAYFKQSRQTGESFGDFCNRIGFEALRQFSDTYEPAKLLGKGRRRRHRISLPDDLYTQLKAAAEKQGKPMTELTAAAIAAYLGARE